MSIIENTKVAKTCIPIRRMFVLTQPAFFFNNILYMKVLKRSKKIPKITTKISLPTTMHRERRIDKKSDGPCHTFLFILF